MSFLTKLLVTGPIETIFSCITCSYLQCCDFRKEYSSIKKMAMTKKMSIFRNQLWIFIKKIMDGNQWGRSLEHYDVSMDILFNLTIH
jgi:hypothetical protein